MPRGPKGEKRPADVIGAPITSERIAKFLMPASIVDAAGTMVAIRPAEYAPPPYFKLMGWTAPATASTCQDEVVGNDLIERSRPWRKLARSVWTWRRACSRCMGWMQRARFWFAGSCGARRC